MVPPVVVWTVAAAGVAIVARLIVREWQRVHEELARAKAAPARTGHDNIPRLRRDPVTGIYRP